MKKVAQSLPRYDHLKIEKKWQKNWAAKKAFKTTESGKKQKCYVLDMFPYPSGKGLHVGHPRGYIASDVYARFMRMHGFNVLHPMGFDGFGLPTEQYAIANKIRPEIATKKNIATYKKQLEILGLSYDWSRAVNTTDPKYYKWTQWIFLKLYNSWYNETKKKAEPIENLIQQFEKKGSHDFSAQEWKSFSEIEKEKILMNYRLAYEGYSEVNWCPELGTVLANDEIVDKDGKSVSERGEYPVEKKSLRQWFLRITAYADTLLSGLDTIDWPAHIKEIQKNWIGKSEGSEIEFALKGREEKITVFTTRADTLFGVTYLVLAPEADLVQKFLPAISNKNEVETYIAEIKNKTEEDRTNATKEKTGVELKGLKAINPANNEEVPVWIADYVLAGYGTGAVMAVPAHDERDFAFAKKYNFSIKEVIVPETGVVQQNPEFRQSIVAIVRNPKTNKFLSINWGTMGGILFIGGGRENNEDVISCAQREIKEETGYYNLKFLAKTGSIYHNYFAKSKNVARRIEAQALFFDLLSEDKEEIQLEKDEVGKFTVSWVTPAEVELHIKDELHKVAYNMLVKNIPYTGEGILSDSEKFDGLTSIEARTKITEAVGGKLVTKYKMRDAVFARQRYWGEPIPLMHKKDGTIVALKENNLPLKLPNVKSYEPIGTGESPLAGVKAWTTKGYETNTMPGWAGSSWYFLRYMDPKNSKKFASEKSLKYWKQVDMYIGGAEHATGHLLYSRFWNHFLYDLGSVLSAEPFKTLKNQGMVLGTDSRKMSKRWGNVVNPDEVVKNVGADTLRIYESFMAPFEQEVPWSTDSMVGSRRFLERVWKLQEKVVSKFADSDEVILLLNQTIKKVEEDIQSFNANTAISAMMIFSNCLEQQEYVSEKSYLSFIKILSPFAPHIAEEIWKNCGNKKMLVMETWPKYDKNNLVSSTVNIAVQINGRVRAALSVSLDASQETVEKLARADTSIVKWLIGANILKVIFIKNKIINFVVR